MITAILARRRILLAKQSGEVLPTDMVLLINSSNTGDFSVTTKYGTFTAAKVSNYPYFGTTVTHKLSISDVTFSTGQHISLTSTVRDLFVGVESWGTSNTYTNTSSLFYGCTKLRGITSSWKGLGAVTKTYQMFYGCASLSSIPASWEGLGSLGDARSMFYGCASLSSIPASWAGLVAVTITDSMFERCASLSSIPDSWEGLDNVTSVYQMFLYCTSLSNCGTIFTGLAKATSVASLFRGCTGMRGNIYALYFYLSEKPIHVNSYAYCFRNCTQAIGYGSIPASWK